MGNSNSSPANSPKAIQFRVIAKTPQNMKKKTMARSQSLSDTLMKNLLNLSNPFHHDAQPPMNGTARNQHHSLGITPDFMTRHLQTNQLQLGPVQRAPRLQPPPPLGPANAAGRNAHFTAGLSVNIHAPIRPSLLNQPREPLTPPTPAIATVQKPCARYVHATCSHKNHMYLFGGFDGTQYLNDLYRFDIIKKEWKLLSKNDASAGKPLQRSDHHVIYRSQEHEVVLFAGWRDPDRLNDTWAYNLKRAQWRKLPIHNEDKMFSNGLTLGSHIYHKKSDSMIIFGGQYGSDESNRVFQLSFADNTWYQVLPGGDVSDEPVSGNVLQRRRRTDASSSMQQQQQQAQQMANSSSGGTSSNAMEDEEDTKNHPLPEARENHSAVWFQDEKYMLIFGGWTGGRCLNDMWLFNMHSHKWTEVKYRNTKDGQVPSARGGHAAVMINDRFLYVYGGYNHPNYFDDLWVFDMETRRWHEAQFAQNQPDQVAPAGSWFHTLNLLTENDRDIPSMVLFGGEDCNNNMLGETLIIQPDDVLRKYWYPNRTVLQFQKHMKDNLQEDVGPMSFSDVIIVCQQ